MKALRVITNSERSAFSCERKWSYGYLEGLTAYDSAAPLRHGSIIHHALAAWYSAEGGLDLSDIVEAVIDPWIDKREEFLTRAGAERGGPEGRSWAEERFREDVEFAELSKVMLGGYFREYASDFDRWKIVAVEGEVARWITLGRKGLRDYAFVYKGERRRRRWAYGGAIDLVVEDREFGGLWAVEHKTTSLSDLADYGRRLIMDPQTRGYAWALRKPVPEISSPSLVGLPPMRGTILNVLRKKSPAVPGLLKSGATSKDSRIDTTREVFLSTLLERGHDPDDYADLLESLRGRSFYYRERFPFTEAELEDFGVDLYAFAERMKSAETYSSHPRQVQACQGPGRYRCEFHDLCLGDNPHAREEFTVKTLRHAELSGDLAEPWMGEARNVSAVHASEVEPLVEAFRSPASSLDAESVSDPFSLALENETINATDDPFADL